MSLYFYGLHWCQKGYFQRSLATNLSLQSHVDNFHKKVVSRIILLGRIWIDITPAVAETKYKVIISSMFLYCSNVNISIPDSQNSKDKKIATSRFKDHNWATQENYFSSYKSHKRYTLYNWSVQVCIGTLTELAKNYFYKQNHTKGAGGNNVNLDVLPIRIEEARMTVYYQGNQIYNKLPTALKIETCVLRFKTSYKAF